jgi:hypothetical protein
METGNMEASRDASHIHHQRSPNQRLVNLADRTDMHPVMKPNQPAVVSNQSFSRPNQALERTADRREEQLRVER